MYKIKIAAILIIASFSSKASVPFGLPTTGLQAWYSFNGNSQNNFSTSFHGTVNGALLSTDRFGRPNNAYWFDGIDDFIDLGSSILNGATTASVSCWMKTTRLTTVQNIWQKRRQSNGDGFYVATFNFNLYGGLNREPLIFVTQSFTPFTTFNDTNWVHLVLTNDNGNLSLYLNGTLLSQRLLQTGAIAGSQPFYIGRGFDVAPDASGNRAFQGSIDDVGIWNRALTAQEITTLYNLDNRIIYYSKGIGNLNQLSTWGTNIDGTGTSPQSFDSTFVTYRVQNNSSPTVGGNWRLGANSTIIFGDGTNSFNLFMSGVDSVFADSMHLNDNTILTVGGHLATSKLTSQPGTTVQYISSSPQIIAAGIYDNIVVSGSTKTLQANTTIRNTLAMVANINCNSFNLTLGTSVTNRGTLNRSSGTIIGSFTRWFTNATNTASAGLFPVGTATRYAPFTLEYTSAPLTGGRVTVDFSNSNPGNVGLPIVDFGLGFVFIDKTANEGFWRATNSTIIGGSFTLTLLLNNFVGVNDFSLLRIIRRNSSGAWGLQGNPLAPTGSNAAATVVRTGLTTLVGEYTVGGDQSVNPLPVKWGSLNVKKVNKSVSSLQWFTLQELNADKFVVERSIDGKRWEIRGEIYAKGNSLVKNSYLFNDNIQEDISVYLYRIKQYDLDGNYEYSQTVTLVLNPEGDVISEISVYPNPASQIIYINGLTFPAFIYDVKGKQILELKQNGNTDINELPNGVYFIKSVNKTLRFIKQ
ncbi:MAG: T9SS type A sorting domain-containing protein [Bacteroidia bacterium]|jgi:hypothetical protein|nr:T9SS type A sorting domain-containing protein [Bacteroidia bacterium]